MDEISPIAPLKELDIFEARPHQNSVVSNFVSEHRPISILKSDSQIQFVITSNKDEYIQLNDMLYYMKLRINISKDTDIQSSDWEKVSFENYLLHSLFKQVSIEINGKQITTSANTYPYRALMEAQLGYTEDAKLSHMTSALYIKDDDDNKESVVSARRKYSTPKIVVKDGTGATLELIDKLKLDIAQQGKSLIGGLEIKITLVPNSPEFYIHSTANDLKYSVDFLESSLFVRKIKVSQNIVDAHSKAIDKSPAIYPISRNEVKAFTINSGTISTSLNNIVFGQIPRRAFVAFVSNDAFNGNLKKNPYNFKQYSLNHLSMHCDGRQIPNKPYTPDFSNDLYIREYIGLYDALNQLSTDSVLKLTRKAWASGNTIYGFNLSNDHSDGLHNSGHINEDKRGNLRLDVKFSSALTETVTCLIFMEYDNIIKIDSEGKISTDFL